AGPDDLDNVAQRGAKRLAAGKILAERPFAAQRLADTVGAHRPEVDPARGAIKVIGEAAEVLTQPGDVLRRQIGAGLYAQPGHLRRPARADAVKAPHRQAPHERRAFA